MFECVMQGACHLLALCCALGKEDREAMETTLVDTLLELKALQNDGIDFGEGPEKIHCDVNL